MTDALNEDLWTDADLDRALDAAREAGEATPDVVYGSGYVAGAEHVVQYLREQRDRTTTSE